MNNELPHYFTNMKPELPRVTEYYSLRRPTFHLPRISHEFVEHMLEYQMIKALNNLKLLHLLLRSRLIHILVLNYKNQNLIYMLTLSLINIWTTAH